MTKERNTNDKPDRSQNNEWWRKTDRDQSNGKVQDGIERRSDVTRDTIPPPPPDN